MGEGSLYVKNYLTRLTGAKLNIPPALTILINPATHCPSIFDEISDNSANIHEI